MPQEVDIRYVDTPLDGSAEHLYKEIYCQRAQRGCLDAPPMKADQPQTCCTARDMQRSAESAELRPQDNR